MPVSKSALQERSRQALKTVKETSRTTTAPGHVWTPPANPPIETTTLKLSARRCACSSKKQVLDRVGVSFPTIWRRMLAGKFPRARTIGDLKSVWLESEVEAWINALPMRHLKDDK